MMSANLILEGDVAFLGIPESKVDGDTFSEKRQTVLRYTVDDLHNMALKCGWFARFKNGTGIAGNSLLVIPSGFIVAIAGKDAKFLRWPLVADHADTRRVAASIRGMIEAFPEYSAPDQVYRQYAGHIGVRLS